VGTEPVDFCREIETYLTKKNDGHLIRVTGPSFEIVSRWAEQGIPLKIAFEGIDRYFERYYAKGSRRRPVKIDFCEADVLDAFDEWKRAVGATSESRTPNPESRRESLPAHLERALMRLSDARAKGVIGEPFDPIIDAVAHELDAARAASGGVRGDARKAMLDRLSQLDTDLLEAARGLLDDPTRATLVREAEGELAGFRAAMTDEAFARARESAVDRLVRQRFALPTIAFS